MRVLGEFGGRPTTKMISTTQTSLSLFIFIPFLFTLHPLYLSFSRIPLENFSPSNFRDLDSLSTLPAPTIPPHANQPLGFKSGSSLINLRFRIYWVDRGWGELTILLIFFSHQVLSWHLFFLIFTGKLIYDLENFRIRNKTSSKFSYESFDGKVSLEVAFPLPRFFYSFRSSRMIPST